MLVVREAGSVKTGSTRDVGTVPVAETDPVAVGSMVDEGSKGADDPEPVSTAEPVPTRVGWLATVLFA